MRVQSNTQNHSFRLQGGHPPPNTTKIFLFAIPKFNSIPPKNYFFLLAGASRAEGKKLLLIMVQFWKHQLRQHSVRVDLTRRSVGVTDFLSCRWLFSGRNLI